MSEQVPAKELRHLERHVPRQDLGVPGSRDSVNRDTDTREKLGT